MRIVALLLLATLTSCDDSQPITSQAWEVDEQPESPAEPVVLPPLTSTVFYPKEMSDPELTDDYAESGSRITINIGAWQSWAFNRELTDAEKEVFNIMFRQTDDEFLWVTIDERVFGHTITFECSNKVLRWRLPDGSVAKCNGKLLHFMFEDPQDLRVRRRYVSPTVAFRLRLSPSKNADGIETELDSEGAQFNNRHITMGT